MLYPTELRGHRQQLNQQLDYVVCVAPSRLLPILLPSDICRNVQPSLGVGAPPAYSRSKSRVELGGASCIVAETWLYRSTGRPIRDLRQVNAKPPIPRPRSSTRSPLVLFVKFPLRPAPAARSCCRARDGRGTRCPPRSGVASS